MSLKYTAIGMLLSVALAVAGVAGTASAKPRDRDKDGIGDRHERLLGTNPNHYTKAKNYVNKVVKYNHITGKLLFYRAKARRVSALVDEETAIYCTDEYYWMDDQFPDDENPDENDTGDIEDGDNEENEEPDWLDEAEPCSDGAIKQREKIDEAKLSYYNGHFFFDSLLLK